MAEAPVIMLREQIGVATVMARRNADAAAIAGLLGLDALPQGPAAIGNDRLRAIGVGPGCWLLVAGAAEADWSATLSARLSGLASVSAQDGAYGVFRLRGEGARTMLQRGAAIDFHPSAFGPGAAATTIIAHIGAVIWCVDAAPTFDVAIFRSYLGSFRHWMDTAVAAL